MKIQNSEQGVMIITVVIFALIVMIAVSSLVGYTMLQIKAQRQAVGQTMGVSIAEAAIESAIWKLNNQAGYSGETGTSYGGGVYNITITDIGSTKLLRAEAFMPDATNPKAKRVVQVTVSNGTTNMKFNYGVQIGNGGLSMQNTSKIIGNVYAGGNITGLNSANITGTVIVSGSSGTISDMTINGNTLSHSINGSTVTGNASHVAITTTDVTGNVSTNTITDSSVGGNAIYNTKTNTTVGGTSTQPNPSVPPDPAQIDMPILDAQVAAWEQDALAGGVIGSQSYSSGTQSLGPAKISGNLTISNSAELVITGTLWVTGQITVSNTAVVKLDPGFGAQSGVIVAGIKDSTTAGYIDLNNGAQIQGSGTAGSYLLLLSQRVGTGVTAIDAGNTGTASILYAGKGKITVNNSGEFKEITAAKIDLSNSAEISYELGLANSNFDSGPGGGWEFMPGTWQLLQ